MEQSMPILYVYLLLSVCVDFIQLLVPLLPPLHQCHALFKLALVLCID